MALKPYFKQDGTTLYHGDCLELLAELRSESFDLAMTDPPYLVSYVGRWGKMTSPISCTSSMESISKEIERDGGVGQGPAHVVRDRFDADVGQLRAVLVRDAVDEHVESSP